MFALILERLPPCFSLGTNSVVVLDTFAKLTLLVDGREKSFK
jgi:hypothetical protein